MTGAPVPYPLSAVVGQDDLKLALLLHAVDPKLGGVLIRGEKGSGKSTAARALATLLPAGSDGEPAPFVELPIGATEDRVVGTLDLEGALLEGKSRLRPGLLAAAHGGVLYVDEVNLLADHLVDVLIDAAAFGINRIERDGLEAVHPCRFVLVGSMNPEEGELRPQLLDRFGLAVEVRAPREPELRTEVVRRRLAFDADPDAFAERFADDEEELRSAIADAAAILGEVVVPDEVLALTSRLCAELDAEGLRADLVLARGAMAAAALDGRKEATADDVVRLAPLALAHRRRRGPLDAPGLSPQELADALERASTEPPAGEPDFSPSTGHDQPGEPPTGGAQRGPRPPAPGVPLALKTQRPSGVLGRRNRGPNDRGGIVAARPDPEGITDIAVAATVQAAAARRAVESPGAGLQSEPAVARADLRQAVRESRTANLVVLCVDASGSMGSDRRIDAAKGAALSLLLDAYQRRDRVALVTFAGEEARVALRPTGSVEVAQARLADLPTGGRTPLGPGLRAALDVARSARHRDPDRRPVIVVVTDGRATSAGPPPAKSPTGAALAAAAEIAAAGIEALVVDAEDGDLRLGLARPLAETMGASYTALPDLVAENLVRAVEAVVAAD